jgi:hypothetical protein
VGALAAVISTSSIGGGWVPALVADRGIESR